MNEAILKNKKFLYIIVAIVVLFGLFYFYLGTLNLAINNMQATPQQSPQASPTLPSSTPSQSSSTPTSNPSTPPSTPSTEPSKSSCVCDWKNKECIGTLVCKSDSGGGHWEKICSCDPPGCGAAKYIGCGSYGEGALSCSQEAC